VDALNEKFPGGLKQFDQKHSIRCNKDLAVICVMAHDYVDDIAEDLVDNGFTREDAVFFDAAIEALAGDDHRRIEFDVNWIEGFVINGRTVVRLVK
jgi:hypothetical protein